MLECILHATCHAICHVEGVCVCVRLLCVLSCVLGSVEKMSKSRGVSVEELKLPPVVDFATGVCVCRNCRVYYPCNNCQLFSQ